MIYDTILKQRGDAPVVDALTRIAEEDEIAITNSRALGIEMPEMMPAVSYEDYRTIVLRPGISEMSYIITLAHEIGHFKTCAFYTLSCPLQTKGRCEAKANAWMVEALCPVDRLQAALDDGCRTYWELAEELDVSEGLIRQALSYYQRKRLL